MSSGILSDDQIASHIADAVAGMAPRGRRVLVLIPDLTRSFPMPFFFRHLVQEFRTAGATAIDFLIALGTHPALSQESIGKLVGLTAEERAADYADVKIFNHAWSDPGALTTLGTIPADEIEQLSEGRLRIDVPVNLNRLVLDYDQLLVCGPVFPHEVVGFSGGNKYFFPGIAGQDIINVTHWLGALLTSYAIIGTTTTPVRAVIDRAAAMIPRERHALCSVMTHQGLTAMFFGTPEAAYLAAAEVSGKTHIIWKDRAYKLALSCLPTMYDEIWVGSKGMYKVEPVVADGGEVIIYAPHITDISSVHGKVLRQIGYHVRDYFTSQWDKFKHLPWGIVAHSTHLPGVGTFENGVEKTRISLTLATGISEAECRAHNLRYRDPRTIDPPSFANREDEGILYVPKAGEYLYRLKSTV